MSILCPMHVNIIGLMRSLPEVERKWRETGNNQEIFPFQTLLRGISLFENLFLSYKSSSAGI